ncbi:MAG: DUF4097 family beta strand repeat protein [Bryobacteraceae bacterium]|nr:DUF4097 family beta strand repeat protein [Bryobacteraceae bacterium]
MRFFATLSLLAAVPGLLSAQSFFENNTEKRLTCENGNNRGWNDGKREQSCEIREYPGAASSRLTIDGSQNGGVEVKGWDRSDTLVRAKVQTWAPTAAEAKALASQINVQAAGAAIRADAPRFGEERGWSVSYEVFVPHNTGLDLKTHNGGVSIRDVRGDIKFDAVNGGVHLARVAGNVTGQTKNGGLSVELAGNRWEGTGMDVSTTNGGVKMTLPENYSARLESSTRNGGFNIDYPVTVTGTLRINKEIAANLGAGGALVRLTTVNGGVSIRKKS